MKALVLENKVVQIADVEFPVSSEMHWMDAPEGCKYGWILQDGQLIEPPQPTKTQAELIAEYRDALQDHIDKTARERDYANGYTCATYANSTNETWKQEAQAFIAWRDSCWSCAIQVLDRVEGGQDAPTLEDFINNVPTINWPVLLE